MSEFNGLLEDLKTNRTGLIDSMMSGKGWDFDQVRQLAEIHGAIAAVEAVIKDGPTRDEYNPENLARGPKFGEDGWPE